SRAPTRFERERKEDVLLPHQLKAQASCSVSNSKPPIGLEHLSQVPEIRTISPSFFTAADYPWLRALIDERQRFVGQRRREWRVRLSEPMPLGAPQWRLRIASNELDRLSEDQSSQLVPPRAIRAALFRHAARGLGQAEAVAQSALQLEMTPEAMLDGLFADLPDERKLCGPTTSLGPVELALACNAALIYLYLAKALRVRIVARGRVCAVVRHARLTGLLCLATPGDAKDEVALEISGPYSLFRHTRIYGRALASLVPRLSWCNAYRLEADCVLGDGNAVERLVLTSGDPVCPARELPPFDSKLEERFARDFGNLARTWEVVREPEAIEAGDSIIFPDFELRHRATGERWILEIAGYWTADYVRKKLSLLKAARIERLILCIDEDRRCTDDQLELNAHVLRYRRNVDTRAVLEIVDPDLLRSLPEPKKRRARRAQNA
ncbi:MAG TPA: DUF790 family protein, partial [Polyangiaceae bacterium]|nr:DUF790 family protein [Polyangiaceae bacterium]